MAFDKCPQCGYTAVPQNKTFSQIHNHYVTEDGKRSAIMNRAEAEFDAVPDATKPENTVKWIRKDVYDKRAVEVKAAKTPETPKK